MKKRLFDMLLALALLNRSYGQGHLYFGNLISMDPPTVTITSVLGLYNPANGPAGACVGSDYTASLYFLSGTITDQTIFDGSNPIWFPPADTLFLGVTGLAPDHGPSVDGAGVFDSWVYLSAATSSYVTVQVRAWYNGNGLYHSYEEALSAGQNVGESNPIPLYLPFGDDVPSAVMSGLQPFTVGIVPEPSSMVLFSFGVLSFVCSAVAKKRAMK